MASTAMDASKAKKLLSLAGDIVSIGAEVGVEGWMAAESLSLARKVSLLIHLFEEIWGFAARNGGAAAVGFTAGMLSSWSRLSEVVMSLEAVKKFLMLRLEQDGDGASFACSARKDMTIQFQYVTWQLEKVLGSISYQYFQISDEVKEETELVRAQLRRETKKVESAYLNIFQEIFSKFTCVHVKSLERQSPFKLEEGQYDPSGSVDQELVDVVTLVAEVSGKSSFEAERMAHSLKKRLKRTGNADISEIAKADRSSDSARSMLEDNKSDSSVIPEDFMCPISLELMRDPVIISTGQTYERSFIQRWIKSGNRTCPKTQQKLQNLSLTPNYVLRSIISQWCEANMIAQPLESISGRNKDDGEVVEVIGDQNLINVLVSELISGSMEERRSAAGEIRFLTKRSMENRKLLADAGAIPALICLLCVGDEKAQENAVTALLNLSIYAPNREAIVLAGALLPITQVLRIGSMEARQNAAAAIFSLSLIDDNKITIGGVPGVIEALIQLLQIGSPRGKKDAASALFNLCIYQGNKSRAVRAGILVPLIQMLKDGQLVNESLTILSLLVSHCEGKEAISEVCIIPLLADFLRTGQERIKENAAAILLGLCKTDSKNLACVGKLGVVTPLTEISVNGSERAKCKAGSLLEQLKKLQTC